MAPSSTTSRQNAAGRSRNRMRKARKVMHQKDAQPPKSGTCLFGGSAQVGTGLSRSRKASVRWFTYSGPPASYRAWNALARKLTQDLELRIQDYVRSPFTRSRARGPDNIDRANGNYVNVGRYGRQFWNGGLEGRESALAGPGGRDQRHLVCRDGKQLVRGTNTNALGVRWHGGCCELPHIANHVRSLSVGCPALCGNSGCSAHDPNQGCNRQRNVH